jgi:hypothetical protein
MVYWYPEAKIFTPRLQLHFETDAKQQQRLFTTTTHASRVRIAYPVRLPRKQDDRNRCRAPSTMWWPSPAACSARGNADEELAPAGGSASSLDAAGRVIVSADDGQNAFKTRWCRIRDTPTCYAAADRCSEAKQRPSICSFVVVLDHGAAGRPTTRREADLAQLRRLGRRSVRFARRKLPQRTPDRM